MTEKEKAELKDRLLSFAIRNGEAMYYRDLFLNRFGPWDLDNDDDLAIALLQEIGEDGNLEINYDYTTKDNPNDFRIIKISKGVAFLNHEGGYSKQYKDLQRKMRREFLKKDLVAWGGWIVAIMTLIYTIFFS